MPRLFPRRAHEPSVALSCMICGRLAIIFRRGQRETCRAHAIALVREEGTQQGCRFAAGLVREGVKSRRGHWRIESRAARLSRIVRSARCPVPLTDPRRIRLAQRRCAPDDWCRMDLGY